jgi:hypothetical protein
VALRFRAILQRIGFADSSEGEVARRCIPWIEASQNLEKCKRTTNFVGISYDFWVVTLAARKAVQDD